MLLIKSVMFYFTICISSLNFCLAPYWELASDSNFKGIVSIIGEKEIALGREQSEQIWEKLVSKGFLDKSGKIQASFTPSEKGFTLGMPESLAPIEAEIISVLQSYQLERHIKNDDN